MAVTVQRNPMGFHCPPNAAAADVISECDFRRFIAYGLLRCYDDLQEPNFSEHEKVDDDHIRELREAFLAVVEDTLLFLWTGEFEIDQEHFDSAQFGDGTYTMIGNTQEGDDVEIMMQWMPYAIRDDLIIFDMACSVMEGEGEGGDPTTLFLDMVAVQDRQLVKDTIAEARKLNACPYRTDYQDKNNEELWKKVLG